MLKEVILAIAAIAVSSAALAHDGRDYERERDRVREHRIERFHEVRRPVIAPRVVYAQPRVVYPQPGIDIHLPL